MAPSNTREILSATTTFHCEVDGRPYTITRGDLYDSRHPVVAGHEGYFEPANTRVVRSDVEEMTNEPGRKRGEERTTPPPPAAKTAKPAEGQMPSEPEPEK